jgi:hypothetical protein
MRKAQALGSDGTWQSAAIGGGAWVAFVVADERHLLPPVAERIIWLRGSVGGVCPVCEQRDWRGSPAAGGFGEYVFRGTCGHGDGDVIGAWSPAATSSPDEL